MKQTLTLHRRAAGLLLAAAALPLTPLFAQDAQPPTPPYAGDGTAPVDPVMPTVEAPAPTPPVATTTAPVTTTTSPSAITTPLPVVRVPVVEEPAPARTTARAPARSSVAAPAPRVAAAAPTASAAPAAPAPTATAADAPLAAAPAGVAPATVPETVPVDTAIPVETGNEAGAIWPWLLAGALAIAALFLFARRRRRASTEVYEEASAAPVTPVAEPEVLAAAPSDGPDPVFAAAAVPAEPAGRPWLDLRMRPVRAGVTGDDAVVEFELTVDNEGSAPARDVRISTFMLAAGSPQESEMERTLIDRPAEGDLPEVDVDAGQAKRLEAAVKLPLTEIDDAILPVVVADARYVLPDGSEGRTSASFAVGVPDGEQMAYFDVEHPSGLHEDVEARLRGEPHKV